MSTNNIAMKTDDLYNNQEWLEDWPDNFDPMYIGG